MPSSALFAQTSSILHLTTVDQVIVALYFVVVLGIGFYLKRYASTSEDFFMAGRKMTAWVAGLSFISANLSSLETMGWSATAYQYGMLGTHAYLIGAIPAILFLAVVMMPFYYVCKTHSVPGYLSLRYGEDSRVLAGISFTVMTVMVCGVNMYAMAKMLHLLLGWNIHASIWVSSLTVAIYVTLGGLLSAVLNEVLQFFLIWLGTLLVPILGIYEAGGWNGMMARIREQNPSSDFTSLWSNMGSAADNPMGMHWAGMVFGLGVAVSFGYWCTDFLQVQRVLTAKSLRAAQNGTIMGAAFKMLVPLIVTIPGLLGLAILLPESGIKLLPENEAILTGGHSYNDVLPLMMARYLGPGLLGLGVTAMIAGFMSGMAGNVSAFATVWTYDVYRPLIRKNASDQHYVLMGRWVSVLGVIVGIATAYAAMRFSNILVYLQVLVLFFIVPLFGVVIMGMLWRNATKQGGFWGLLIGTLLSIALFFFSRWFPDGYNRFLARDMTNLPRLVERLDKPNDDLSAYVAAQFSPEANQFIDEYRTEKNQAVASQGFFESLGDYFREDSRSAMRAKIVLIDGFNKLLADPNLPQRAGQTPAQENLSKEELEKTNRRILSEAFSDSIEPPRRLESTQINPRHAEIITTSPLATDMTVNYFSAIWSLLVTTGTVLMVSLFSKPKTDEELRNLVFGLTPMHEEEPAPWYQSPILWASVVLAVLIAINVIFW